MLRDLISQGFLLLLVVFFELVPPLGELILVRWLLLSVRQLISLVNHQPMAVILFLFKQLLLGFCLHEVLKNAGGFFVGLWEIGFLKSCLDVFEGLNNWVVESIFLRLYVWQILSIWLCWALIYVSLETFVKGAIISLMHFYFILFKN